MTRFEANVGNVGCIGYFPSKAAAVRACRVAIKSYGRADGSWHVCDEDGEIVAESGGRSSRE